MKSYSAGLLAGLLFFASAALAMDVRPFVKEAPFDATTVCGLPRDVWRIIVKNHVTNQSLLRAVKDLISLRRVNRSLCVLTYEQPVIDAYLRKIDHIEEVAFAQLRSLLREALSTGYLYKNEPLFIRRLLSIIERAPVFLNQVWTLINWWKYPRQNDPLLGRFPQYCLLYGTPLSTEAYAKHIAEAIPAACIIKSGSELVDSSTSSRSTHLNAFLREAVWVQRNAKLGKAIIMIKDLAPLNGLDEQSRARAWNFRDELHHFEASGNYTGIYLLLASDSLENLGAMNVNGRVFTVPLLEDPQPNIAESIQKLSAAV